MVVCSLTFVCLFNPEQSSTLRRVVPPEGGKVPEFTPGLPKGFARITWVAIQIFGSQCHGLVLDLAGGGGTGHLLAELCHSHVGEH